MGPFGFVDPAKSNPLATVTGPAEVALPGLAVDHRILPLLVSIATHPPAVVVFSEGLRVKFLRLELAMFVYNLLLSVADPQVPPPKRPPGPASYIKILVSKLQKLCIN
jgi:hypothetical protein